jgi:hypothetical protein
VHSDASQFPPSKRQHPCVSPSSSLELQCMLVTAKRTGTERNGKAQHCSIARR